MKLALVTDAWTPQVNGVVRTLKTTVERMRELGHEVTVLSPEQCRTLPCPTYPEIRLALAPRRHVSRTLDGCDADAIHIATEGPLGWAARRWCLTRNVPFTTSFHTHFADYASLRTGLPAAWFWRLLRLFHSPAAAIFAATGSLDAELHDHGLLQTRRWSRGVDLSLFRPEGPGLPALHALAGPLLLYVGRVAAEKNIEAFLRAATPGTKVIVGDGPARPRLQAQFPAARFLGALHGTALAAAYRSADVLVFPSLTDTFGLVMIEALASGLPVAAYPVRGPLSVIGLDGCGLGGLPVGALDGDLVAAITAALNIDRAPCAGEAALYRWEASTDQFLSGLKPWKGPGR